MGERRWTDEQKKAIEARGGTVLVSAAAGSGKTAVLVERILERLTDPENPVSANRLLVVTFTKAAAAEMLQRLTKGLDERLQKDPANPLLRRQMLMLPMAHISTTHAFCASLLRDQFHLLGLSPDFKVLEDKQASLLAHEALTEYLQEAYASKDEDFMLLAESVGVHNDDRAVSQMIRRLYDFVSAFPFPKDWLNLYAYMADDGVYGWLHYDLHRCYKIELLTEKGLSYLDWAIRFLQEDPGSRLSEACLPMLERDCLLFLRARENFSAVFDRLVSSKDETVEELPSLEEAYAELAGLEWERFPTIRREIDPEAKAFVQNLRKHAKKAWTAIGALFEHDPADLRVAQQLSSKVIGALVQAVYGFTAKYDEKKAAMNALDFSDLEHKTIELLYESPEVLSPHAAELAADFDEILVDEYQDTNEVQDAIFRALSRNGENLFYVGDVKQSIYSFRQARPQLFVEQRKRGHAYESGRYPVTVTLGHNFRSRHEVTDTVNFFFSGLMQEPFGGVEYDENEKLICRAEYPKAAGGEYATELTLIDVAGSTGMTDTAEAQCIAADIERMMATLKVTEDGYLRPAKYKDFCILLRSKSAHADTYVKELTARGIPAFSSGGGGFFAAPEVGVMLSLLRFLDNPSLDIALASLMMSPLYRFSVDDMARVRMTDRHIPLIAAVQKAAKADDDLGTRCREFLEQTTRWRTLAPVLTVDRLLERLYDESAITDVYGVQKGGLQRVANLQQLFAMAHDFEENGYRGLSAFVRMCDRMEESSQDIDPAPVSGGSADGVPVISIHHSKGLEFPVVFLAGCSVSFNTEDTKGDMLLHREAGIGLRLHDRDTLVEYDTPERLTARQLILTQGLEENLRVLYVAMTRAKEKLCIVSADSNLKAELEARLVRSSNGRLPLYSLAFAGSFQDWLLPMAALHTDCRALWEYVGYPRPEEDEECGKGSAIDLRILRYSADSGIEETVAERSTETADPDAVLVERWRERLAWRYPYTALKDIPNKLAAAGIAHQEMDEAYIAASKPAFMEKGGLSAAGRGTAMHQFMQFADYVAASQSVTAERDRLCGNGWLSQKQADSLDMARLETFFHSDLYRRMAQAEALMRELPFVAERPAAEIFPALSLTGEAAAEPIAIQGVADCVFVENGEIVIVDYKTDRVKTADTLVERYAPQVQIYARAMSAALGLPVRQCLLWSFALGRQVEVPVK